VAIGLALDIGLAFQTSHSQEHIPNLKFHYQSPIGAMAWRATSRGITSLVFVDEPADLVNPSSHDSSLVKQLDEYFLGKRSVFDLPLDAQGTDFQKRVWKEISKIPYGRTATYKEIAARIDAPKAIRAVASALAANPLHLIAPCHRVIGSNGSLSGYAGGLWRKKWLLDFEAGKQLRCELADLPN
jgi:methylated-DNA-[protein]-cysteine S-methyltransferase